MVATALQPNAPGSSSTSNTASTVDSEQGSTLGAQPTAAERQRVSDLQEQFQQQAQKDPAGFRLALREAFGDKASLAKIDQLLDMALTGKLSMPSNIQFVETGSLGSNALGAYDSSNGGSLYLDRSLLSDPTKLQSVFNEEMGHHLDALLGGADAAGDEGAVFSRTLEQGPLSQSELTSLKNENDHGVIQLEGRWVQVEFSEEGSGEESGDGGGSDGDGGNSTSGDTGGGECSVGGGESTGGGSGGSETSSDDGGGESTSGDTGGECSVGGDDGNGGTQGADEPDEPDTNPQEHVNGNSDSDRAEGVQGTQAGGDGTDPGDDQEAGDGEDLGNTDTGNAADQDRAKSLTDTAANSADAAKENLERSPDMQSNSTGVRGALGRAADAFGKVFGGLSTALGFSKGYDRERDRGGSKADAVREGFREVALDVDDGVITGAGVTGGALVGGAIGTVTPAGPVGTAVFAAGGGLAGAGAANKLYNDSALDAGFDLGVNYVFDTIESWQHRE